MKKCKSENAKCGIEDFSDFDFAFFIFRFAFFIARDHCASAWYCSFPVRKPKETQPDADGTNVKWPSLKPDAPAKEHNANLRVPSLALQALVKPKIRAACAEVQRL
jgi:hypothetical protein